MNSAKLLLQGYIGLINTYHGPMMYNVRDVFISECLERYGEWARTEIEETLAYAIDGTVVDAGAYIGTHTLSYAKVAKRVVSFEPQPFSFNILCGNVGLNCFQNVIPMRSALGDTCGIVPMQQIDYNTVDNFSGSEVGKGDGVTQVITLDSLNIDDVTLIKMDVEGYEYKALTGARETIERCRPVLYLEYEQEKVKPAIHQILDEMHYLYTPHNAPLYREDNYARGVENVFEGVFSHNLLCIPLEKVNE